MNSKELAHIIRGNLLDVYNSRLTKKENHTISNIIMTDDCEKLGDKSCSLAIQTKDEHLYAIFIVQVV